jgi:hypothetical protein
LTKQHLSELEGFLDREGINMMKNRAVKIPRFSEGDIVHIRAKEKIADGLDQYNEHEGCLMMEQMWEYCGKNYKVIKVVQNFFDEYKYTMYKVRSPLYILDGLICNGISKAFDRKCDRSCFLLWHEEWLEKV